MWRPLDLCHVLEHENSLEHSRILTSIYIACAIHVELVCVYDCMVVVASTLI